MKTNKKIIIIICILIFVFIIGSVITIILSNSNYNKNIKNEKIDSEISYLDNNLLSIFSKITDDDNPNWENIKSKVLDLYFSWNSIILDLNNIQIKNTNLTSFGKKLDDLMISVNERNKNRLFSSISDLYYLLILYTEDYDSNYNLKTNINGKYNLIKTYSLIETNNWTLINESITNLEKIYYNGINNINYNCKNDLQIKKIYISVKELENAVVLKNKELFYIKFKIIMKNFKN